MGTEGSGERGAAAGGDGVGKRRGWEERRGGKRKAGELSGAEPRGKAEVV